MITELTNADYTGFAADGAGVMDFWATWCGPCRMIAPILDEISSETGLNVGKVNVDEQIEIARAFGIEAIPTLVFIKNGVETGRVTGYRPKNELQAIIGKFLG